MQVTLSQTPAAPDPGYLPARRVWERYGITSMSLHRWVNDPALNFPRPMYFGRFRFWRLSELEEWERRQPRGKAA